jgi:two-component system chemotaxis response regulator CheB
MSLPSTHKGSPIRVMVVDDSIFMRKALERILLSAGDIEICESVATGELALAKLDSARPDIVTMDVEMPGMGGLEAVRAILSRRYVPILMLSAQTARGSEAAMRALEYGAADFLAKPSGGVNEIARITTDLVQKVRTLAHSAHEHASVPHEEARTSLTVFNATKRRFVECIAIGISTGGPPALAEVCKALDVSAKVPVLVVQHMPKGFTKSLAERLNSQCAIEVVEAEDQMPVLPGRIVIGVSGMQMRVKRVDGRPVIFISETKGESLYMPCADVLFRSVAEAFGNTAMAFIMTGMGNDGTEGLRELKKAGGYVYGQDNATSIVYGMPRAAAIAGLVDTSLPLGFVAPAICAAAKGFVV